jgi:hypothetical protein
VRDSGYAGVTMHADLARRQTPGGFVLPVPKVAMPGEGRRAAMLTLTRNAEVSQVAARAQQHDICCGPERCPAQVNEKNKRAASRTKRWPDAGRNARALARNAQTERISRDRLRGRRRRG